MRASLFQQYNKALASCGAARIAGGESEAGAGADSIQKPHIEEIFHRSQAFYAIFSEIVLLRGVNSRFTLKFDRQMVILYLLC